MVTSALKCPSVLLWSEIDKWTMTSSLLRFGEIPPDWRILFVHEFASLIENKEQVEPEKEYQMAGVRWYGEGVFHRETVLGKEQSARYLSPLRRGAMIYNRLFAWKESFAVVTSEFHGLYVSTEFPQFVIDENIVLAQYVYLLFNSRKIIQAVNAASIGSSSVSRNRFKESDFLSFKVPIPPLFIQRQIVDCWEMAQLEIQANHCAIEECQKKCEIELLKKLGIQIPAVIKRKGQFSINLSQNERWDTFFFRKDFILLENQMLKMPNITLGDALNFCSRGWNKNDFKSGTFEYIEISSVNKQTGIFNTKTVRVEKAPSRATTKLRAGDLIISTTRPYLGAFSLVDHNYDGCICSSGFALADSVKTDKITKNFILFFLKSPAGLRQFERRMSGGLYPAIVSSELEKILLPLPPLEVQNKIISEYEKSLFDINRLQADIIKIKSDIVLKKERLILGKLSVKEL